MCGQDRAGGATHREFQGLQLGGRLRGVGGLLRLALGAARGRAAVARVARAVHRLLHPTAQQTRPSIGLRFPISAAADEVWGRAP
jgi:hypothetical protein